MLRGKQKEGKKKNTKMKYTKNLRVRILNNTVNNSLQRMKVKSASCTLSRVLWGNFPTL